VTELLVQLSGEVDLDGLWLSEGTTLTARVGEVEVELRDEGRPQQHITIGGETHPLTSFDPRHRTVLVARHVSAPSPGQAEALRSYFDAHEVRDDGWITIPVDHEAEKTACEFLWPLEADLRRAAMHVLGLLRWRFGRTSSAEPLVHERVVWSIGRMSHLLRIPDRDDVERGWALEEDWEDDDSGQAFVLRADVEAPLQVVVDQQREPLAHFLRHEAWSLRGLNPRGSLLLAVSAAETALKTFIGEGSPERAWLIQEVPSPPILKLMREYLPLLTDHRTRDGRVIPKSVTRIIQDAVERRNLVAHEGAPAPDASDLEQILASVGDLLYILDWLSGEDWAFKCIQEHLHGEWEEGH
jgi:hypothetical protein